MKKYLSSIPFRFYLTAFCLFLAFSFVARIALFLTSFPEISLNPALLGALGVGVLFDFAAGIFAALPWLLLGIGLTLSQTAAQAMLGTLRGTRPTIGLVRFTLSLPAA